MKIIVVSFPYHVCPKKAIAQIVLKIKSADRTKVLVFHCGIAVKFEDNALKNNKFSFI